MAKEAAPASDPAAAAAPGNEAETSPAKPGKGRGKSARIPLDPHALLDFEGAGPLVQRIDILKKEVKVGTMSSFQPEVKKAFDTEARRVASEAEKLYKEFSHISNRLQRRTLKNEEGLDILNGHLQVCKSISMVAAAVPKANFSLPELEEHLEAFSAFGAGIQFRIWKQRALDLARLGKDGELVASLKNGCDFVEGSTAQESVRERVVEQLVESCFLHALADDAADCFVTRIRRLLNLMTQMLATEPGSSPLISAEGTKDLATFANALVIWREESDNVNVSETGCSAFTDDMWNCSQEAAQGGQVGGVMDNGPHAFAVALLPLGLCRRESHGSFVAASRPLRAIVVIGLLAACVMLHAA